MGLLDNLNAVGAGVGNAMQGAGNFVQNAGSRMMSGLQAPADPTAINPQYGVPEGDVYAAKMAQLRQMSATFMAAGAAGTDDARAKILAGLADNGDPSKQLYTMAQARLMNNQVADADKKRKQKEEALARMKGKDLSSFATPREQELFNLYVEAGDADGALDVISRARASSNEAVGLTDGTTVTKGVALSNRKTFDKEFAKSLNDFDRNVEMWTLIDEAIDGMKPGATQQMQVTAMKLARAAGLNIDATQITKSEQFKALVVEPALQYMSQLGGNDSNEELARMMTAIGDPSMEPESLRFNARRGLKQTFQKAGIASEQMRRLGKNGQNDFNGYVQFKREMIPGNLEVYDRYFGAPAPAQAAPRQVGPASEGNGSGAPAAGTVMDGYRFKGGDPTDENNWEQVQ